MKNKELKELKARNVLVENVIKKIKIETDNINEKLEYSKRYKKIKVCGTSEMRTDGKVYINKCNDKFCQICLTRERRKRFNKLKKIFEKSETKLEKGYVEAFLTLNFNYNSEDVKNMKLAEYLEYFQKMFKKFCEELKKRNCLGYIYKKEFPYVIDKKRFNLHYHVWVCVKKEDLEKLQGIWHKITKKCGNLHIGNTKNENFGITQKFYECEENKRNISKQKVEKICNYLAKSYLSSAAKYNENDSDSNSDKIGLVEDIKNKEVLEKMMKATDKQLENFKCLGFGGIYNLTTYEKERKSEKSRMFEVFEYDPKILEEMKLPNADIFSDEEKRKLLLRFDVNNNTVEKIEKKFGGKAFALKGKGKWSEKLEAGNFKEVKRIGMKNIEKKPIKKKTPVTTEKTTVETFEIFGNIEEIKNKIINSGTGAMAWATELVQVILPYTNIKIKQSSDEDKQTIEKLEKRVKELETELQGFGIEKNQKTFSDEKQSEKSDFIVIQAENETIELEEYKMLSGGGYCYITKDKNKAYINTMFAKKYDKKSFRAERIEHYKNFEEFNKKYQLKKTF